MSNILMVDDDEMILRVVSRILSMVHYHQSSFLLFL